MASTPLAFHVLTLKMFHAGPSARVQAFLLGVLAATTQRRYLEATQTFIDWCSVRQIQWATLTEERQDWVMADFVLDAFDEGHPPSLAKDAVAAVSSRR